MAALRPLEKKLEEFCIASHTCDQVFKHTLSQAQQTERQIKDEFEKLHQFLREEKEARIAALKEEEEQKSQMMKEMIEKMKGDIASLSDTITAVKDQLETDDLSFLQTYGETMKRVWEAPQGPEKLQGALIDKVKHLGNLTYRVWEKMLGTVQYTPVTLDPNTAAPSILLTEDLTGGGSKREVASGQQDQVPDNPERFGRYACVLGSRGFSSGRHSWQVEVGASTNWTLGVASGRLSRKEEFSACPEEGVWTISHRDGSYWAMDTPCYPLPVRDRLQRVRVELDWDGGRVTFSDPNNADGAPLHTFTHPFTEPLYPYFESLCTQQPLRILPEKLSVQVEEDLPGEDLTSPDSNRSPEAIS